MISSLDPRKRFDWLAALAFALAFAIMVLPIEADILLGLFIEQQIALAGLVAILCFMVVLIPVMLSWRRHRSHPNAWRGRGYLNAATIILVINLLMFGVVFIGQLRRHST
jgi:hypothetical protein